MAGKIPKQFIDQLLSQADVVDVIKQYVTLKKSGHNYSACCPFHDEKTPSFSVSPTKQFYYCFGCGAHGDAIGFIQNFNHLSFVEAIETLAKQMALEVPYEISNDKQATKRRSEYEQMYDLLGQACEYFQAQLKAGPGATARDYCKSRGLTGEIAKIYSIGLAPSGWDNLQKTLDTNGKHTDLLLKAGLLSKNDKGRIYDKFRDRLMFPIRDNRGRTVAFGGRVLQPDAMPKYLNSPETPVFHKSKILYGLYEAKQQLKRIDSLLVVEGYMDVIALAQAGLSNAVATMGTATTIDHLRILFKEADQIVFCFDGDRAGKQAAWRALTTALPLMDGANVIRFLFLPDGEDPDTLIRAQGVDAFKQLLNNALPLGEFLLSALAKDYNLNRADSRAQYLSKVLPYVKQMPEGSMRLVMINQLATKTHLSPQQIQVQLIGKTQPRTTTSIPKSVALSTIERAIYYILANPKLLTEIAQPPLSQTPETELLLHLTAWILENNPDNTATVLRHWPHGDKSKQELARIASSPSEIGHITSAQALQDLMLKLELEAHKVELDILLTKSKHAVLTAQEKTRLTSLFQQLK